MIVGCLECWLSWCGELFVFYAICALWNDVVFFWWWMLINEYDDDSLVDYDLLNCMDVNA